MEKNEFEKYLKRLEELEKQLNTEDNFDPDFLSELNNIIGGISKDVKPTATLKFINKSNNPDPIFAHEGDSGFDLRAHITDVKEINIAPGSYGVVPTGLYFEIEKGLEVQVRPRSGLAYNHGITIVNSPGTIDSHYRGEIKIILANLGSENFIIKNGDRIAQGVVCPVYGEGYLDFQKTEKLSPTVRNSDGFGSTGKN